MEETLNALSGLLLKALPTFLLLIALHFYLKSMFFSPLDRVLEARRQATEGARTKAQTSLERAASMAAEYHAAMRAARGEIYKEQEETRREWDRQQSMALDESRRNTSGMVRQARVELAAEAAAAGQALASEKERLAGLIAESILHGRRA